MDTLALKKPVKWYDTSHINFKKLRFCHLMLKVMSSVITLF